jgi:hypothetical protein
MKKIFYSLVLFCNLGHAMAADGSLISTSSERTFIPRGFDDNDQTLIVIEGRLPNDCYRLETPEIKTDHANHEIFVQPKAAYYNWLCLEVLVPWTQVVTIGKLEAGDWSLKVGTSRPAEAFAIKHSSTLSPDDFVYAPVDTLNIDVTSQFAVATIRGRFASRCAELQEVKLIDSGNTIEVLPIMKAGTARNCEQKDQQFEYKFELPIKSSGRYLVHVRSLNGQSINQVYEVQ